MEQADGSLALYKDILARVTFSLQTKRAEVELLSQMLENAHRSIAVHEREAASLRTLIEKMQAGESGKGGTGRNELLASSDYSAKSAFAEPRQDLPDARDRSPTGLAPGTGSTARALLPAEISREPTVEELRQSIHGLGAEDLQILRTAIDAHSGRTGGEVEGSKDGDLKPGRNGRAPRGFGRAVRSIAHDSIAAAARPLRRAQIVSAVAKSGIPVPAKSLAQKVSKILVNDPDLVNIKGKGYWFRHDGVRAIDPAHSDK